MAALAPAAAHRAPAPLPPAARRAALVGSGTCLPSGAGLTACCSEPALPMSWLAHSMSMLARSNALRGRCPGEDAGPLSCTTSSTCSPAQSVSHSACGRREDMRHAKARAWSSSASSACRSRATMRLRVLPALAALLTSCSSMRTGCGW